MHHKNNPPDTWVERLRINLEEHNLMCTICNCTNTCMYNKYLYECNHELTTKLMDKT